MLLAQHDLDSIKLPIQTLKNTKIKKPMKIKQLKNLRNEVRAISEIPAHISRIPEIIRGASYYPEKERKSNLHIFLDNLIWIIKNKELNDSYNYNGLDIKKWRNLDDFLPKRQFIKDRTLGNSCEKEELGYNYLAVLRDKYLFSSYLSQVIGRDKVIPTVALYSDENFYLPSEKIYISLEDFFRKDRRVFCKVNNGECAKEVFVIESSNNSYYLNNEKTTLSEIKLKVENSRFIFQNIIQQHDVLSNLNIVNLR